MSVALAGAAPHPILSRLFLVARWRPECRLFYWELPMKRPGQLKGARLPDKARDTQPHLCLRCGKKFLSNGSANRLCKRCGGKKLVRQV